MSKLTAPQVPSKILEAVIGPGKTSRMDASGKFWKYVDARGFREAESTVRAGDDSLRALFGGRERVTFHEALEAVYENLGKRKLFDEKAEVAAGVPRAVVKLLEKLGWERPIDKAEPPGFADARRRLGMEIPPAIRYLLPLLDDLAGGYTCNGFPDLELGETHSNGPYEGLTGMVLLGFDDAEGCFFFDPQDRKKKGAWAIFVTDPGFFDAEDAHFVAKDIVRFIVGAKEDDDE